jgi:hypothetical protein
MINQTPIKRQNSTDCWEKQVIDIKLPSGMIFTARRGDVWKCKGYFLTTYAVTPSSCFEDMVNMLYTDNQKNKLSIKTKNICNRVRNKRLENLDAKKIIYASKEIRLKFYQWSLCSRCGNDSAAVDLSVDYERKIIEFLCDKH